MHTVKRTILQWWGAYIVVSRFVTHNNHNDDDDNNPMDRVVPPARLTQIVHVGDIFLRHNRRDEYTDVFDVLTSLVESLLRESHGKTVVLISGNVFDTRRQPLSSTVIDLFFRMLHIARHTHEVLIVRGTHDRTKPNDPDLLESMLRHAPPNVRYLDRTGLYSVEDVNIALLDDGDVEDPVACMQLARLVEDAAASSSSTRVVGVCHTARFDVNLEAFKHCEVVLCGGNSQMQLHGGVMLSPAPYVPGKRAHVIESRGWEDDGKMCCCWGYCGSLIQQNFAETPYRHGVLVWDLDARVVNAYHIHNTRGMISVIPGRDGGTPTAVVDNSGIKTLGLRAALSRPWFPREICVRVGASIARETLAFFSEHGVVVRESNTPHHNDDASSSLSEPAAPWAFDSIDDFETYVSNNHVAVLEHVGRDTWSTWLRHHSTLLVPQMDVRNDDETRYLFETVCRRVTDVNEALNRDLVKRVPPRACAHPFDVKTRDLDVVHLQWQWMLCYGPYNWVEFDKLRGNIGLIAADNGRGKTSMLEVLCLAIFGEGIPSRSSTHASVVCVRKPPKARATTSVWVRIHGHDDDNSSTTFEITRAFAAPSESTPPMAFFAVRSANGDVLRQGKTAVAKWVTEHIGTLEGFLGSALLTQSRDMDFFDRSSKDQLTTITETLDLESTQATVNASLSEALRHHTNVLKVCGDALSHCVSTRDELRRTIERIAARAGIEIVESDARDVLSIARSEAIDLRERIDTLLYVIRTCSTRVVVAGNSEDARQMEDNHEGYSYDRLFVLLHDDLLPLCDDYEDEDAMNLESTWARQVLEVENAVSVVKAYGAADEDEAADASPECDCTMSREEASGVLQRWEGWVEAANLQHHHTLVDVATHDETIRCAVEATERAAKASEQHLQAARDALCTAQAAYQAALKDESRSTVVELEDAMGDIQLTYDDDDQDEGDDDDCGGDPTLLERRMQELRLEVERLRADAAKVGDGSVMSLYEARALRREYDAWCRANGISVDERIDQKNIIDTFEFRILELLRSDVDAKDTAEDAKRACEALEADVQHASERMYRAIGGRDSLLTADGAIQRGDAVMDLITRACETIVRSCVDADANVVDAVIELSHRSMHVSSQASTFETRLAALRNEIRASTDLIQSAASCMSFFNEECWACRQQPLRLRAEHAREKLATQERDAFELQTRLDALLGKDPDERHSLEKWKATYIATQAWVTEYRSRIGEEPCSESARRWMTAREAALEYRDAQKKLDEARENANVALRTSMFYDSAIDDAHRIIREAQRWSARCPYDVLRLWTELNLNMTALARHSRSMRRLRSRNARQRTNVAQLEVTRLEEHLRLAEKHAHDACLEKEKAATHARNWSAVRGVWEDMRRDVRAARSALDTLRKRERHDALRRLDDARHQLSRTEALRNMRSSLARRTVWVAERLLSESNSREATLIKTIGRLEGLQDDMDKTNRGIQMIERFRDEIKRRHAALDVLCSQMRSFRSWMYTHRVAPALQHETNALLSKILATDDDVHNRFHVMFDVARNEFIWKWGGMYPESSCGLARASGFQRFAIGLVFRLALTRLSRSTTRWRQLFLDEPFVSCDTRHVTHVPAFLRSLLNTYDCVIVASHLLDATYDAADQRVEIDAAGSTGLSRLQFGAERR